MTALNAACAAIAGYSEPLRRRMVANSRAALNIKINHKAPDSGRIVQPVASSARPWWHRWIRPKAAHSMMVLARVLKDCSSERCSMPRKKISSPIGLNSSAGAVKMRYSVGTEKCEVSRVAR